MQRKLTVVIHHSMPCIVTALIPDHQIRALTQIVNDTSLTLVPPLCANNCCNWH